MDRDLALEKVREVISNQLSIEKDKVTEDAHFINDLGADSLDLVELVMAFEEEFDVEIPDEDTEKLQTVSDCVNYILSKVKAD
jgi:acyl carrier protein